jgi:hypothetical protein
MWHQGCNMLARTRTLLAIGAVAACAIGALAGCMAIDASAERLGYLEGRVTIGPICPVEREGVPCPVPPEAYAAREIVLRAEGKIVARTRPGSDGNYRLAAEPGRYVVDVNRTGVDSSTDVPREVEIRAGETTRLDIAIDTGIRLPAAGQLR